MKSIYKSAIKASKKIRDSIIYAGHKILDKISITSTGKYFRTGRVVKTRTGRISYTKPKPLPGKLTSRSGDLVRSLLGSRNFRTGGGVQDHIREIDVSSKNIKFTLGSNVRSKKGFDYPKYHEQHGRPFLEPAFEDNIRTAEKLLQIAVNKDVKL